MAKWKEGVKIFLFNQRVSCLHCQNEVEEPLMVKYRGKTEHFCGEMCASLYWLERIRGAGL